MNKENNKSKRMLDCILTDQELAECGKELARTNQRKARLEAEKKSTASHYKAEMDQCDAEIEQLSLKSTTGVESRMVECQLFYNNPEDGLKTLIRLDTEEKVYTEPMTVDERTDMFINALGEQDGKFIMRDRTAIPVITEDNYEVDNKEERWTEILSAVNAEDLIDQPLTDGVEYIVVKIDNEPDSLYSLCYLDADGGD
jgi:hypothetical protein